MQLIKIGEMRLPFEYTLEKTLKIYLERLFVALKVFFYISIVFTTIIWLNSLPLAHTRVGYLLLSIFLFRDRFLTRKIYSQKRLIKELTLLNNLLTKHKDQLKELVRVMSDTEPTYKPYPEMKFNDLRKDEVSTNKDNSSINNLID